MESAYGEDDAKWPSAGLEEEHCISKDCKDIEGGVKLLSNEERRAQLQSKVWNGIPLICVSSYVQAHLRISAFWEKTVGRNAAG